jgi:hypothetical protein
MFRNRGVGISAESKRRAVGVLGSILQHDGQHGRVRDDRVAKVEGAERSRAGGRAGRPGQGCRGGRCGRRGCRSGRSVWCGRCIGAENKHVVEIRMEHSAALIHNVGLDVDGGHVLCIAQVDEFDGIAVRTRMKEKEERDRENSLI